MMRCSRKLLLAAAGALAWLTTATTAPAHGAYHDLARQLAEEIARHPDDAGLHYRLACAHQEHGELQPTLEELAVVERLAPGKYDTRLVRGLVYATNYRWADARKELDAALAANPKNHRALAERAVVLLRLKETDPAIADGRKALAADPQDIEFITRWATELRARQQPAEALRVARQGLESFQQDPALLLLALELETAQKDFTAALTRVDALQKCWPRPETWMQRRAELLAAAGRPVEAQAAWNTLRAHILALPNLERANPSLDEILARCEKELGIHAPPAVVAPPAVSAR